jgi:hypothetical protein
VEQKKKKMVKKKTKKPHNMPFPGAEQVTLSWGIEAPNGGFIVFFFIIFFFFATLF